MSRFITADCNFCGEPNISLTQCPICKEGYCEKCLNIATEEHPSGERVCKECMEDARSNLI